MTCKYDTKDKILQISPKMCRIWYDISYKDADFIY